MGPRDANHILAGLGLSFAPAQLRPEPSDDLIGHWPLAGDLRDVSGGGRHASNHDTDLNAPGPDGKPRGAASFDGRGSWLEIPGGMRFGHGDFTISVRVHT